MTLATTRESDCTEIRVVRAVAPAAAGTLVPDRYAPLEIVGSGGVTAWRFQMWDYVCERLSLDGQTHAPRTQVSIGAIQLRARDGDPVTGAYFLVYLATDNPVLAARFRQVGLPADFAPDLSATVSDPTASPFVLAFSAPSAAFSIQSVAATAPVPVAVAGGGPTLYFDGEAGEVQLSYVNTMLAEGTASTVADYRQHEILAPIIFLPGLLQITGASFPVTRGDWTGTVTRVP